MSGPANTQFAVGAHMLTLLSASGGGPLSSDEMATSANANPVYVRRVLGRLRVAGLVTSRPGVHGGWQLARDPGGITLGDVWRAIHAGEPLLGLHAANPSCPIGREVQRTLGDVDRRAGRAVEAELDGINLLELLPGVQVA
jgi:Rrf2 family protein